MQKLNHLGSRNRETYHSSISGDVRQKVHVVIQNAVAVRWKVNHLFAQRHTTVVDSVLQLVTVGRVFL